ncbi:MAG TPA: glycosyltransferase [Verrucomicrobiae bacterium]|nr:glycosyltransferase [Verrucomicrobiae bacterium]
MQPLIQETVFYFFACISVLYVVHLGLYLVSANFYDIWQYRRRSSGRHKLKGTPLISVVIAAYNEQKVIVRSLESLRHTNYPNFEVLVADNASVDGTLQLVRDYALRHPDMNLRAYRMRGNLGKGGALNVLLRRHARGEFAMTLDADSLVQPDTIRKALSYFADPTIAGVAANVRILDEPTMLGVLQKFEHMIGYRSKKMYSLLNCEFVVGGVASTYRTEVLRRVGFYDTDTMTEDIGLSIKITNLGNRAHRMVYAADVVAMTEGVSSLKALIRQRFRWKYGSFQNLIKYRHLLFNPGSHYSRTLTLYRMPMALLSEVVLLSAPLAWGYVLYVTLHEYSLTLVIGAYVTVTLYMLLTIWLDENLSMRGRLRLSGYALVSYFLFLIMDIVQLIDIAKCLRRSHALLKQQATASTWTSPARSGGKVQHAYET